MPMSNGTLPSAAGTHPTPLFRGIDRSLVAPTSLALATDELDAETESGERTPQIARRPLGVADECSSNKTASAAVKGTMNRLDKHDLPKRRIAARLRRMGLNVRNVSSANGYDLLVNDDLRVTLRVAFPGLRRHRVTVAGRTYQYRYRTWHFNFHHHGKLKERYTDFFICLGVSPGQRGKGDTFVIPWEKVTGKTFSLHGGRGPYGGRYAPYRDAWQLIAARTSPLRRVA